MALGDISLEDMVSKFVQEELLPQLYKLPDHVVSEVRYVFFGEDLGTVSQKDPASLVLAVLEVVGIDYLEPMIMIIESGTILREAFSDVDSLKLVLLDNYAVTSEEARELVENTGLSQAITAYKRAIQEREVLKKLIKLIPEENNYIRNHFQTMILPEEAH